MSWRPLSVRGHPEAVEQYDVLHEGVPPWLAKAVRDWVEGTLATYDFGTALKRAEHLLRLPLDWSGGELTALRSLTMEILRNGPRALDIVDCCLFLAPVGGESLDLMLLLGGSAWAVGEDAEGRSCLVRRVDETVEEAAREEIEQAGKAGRHLRAAWHGVYGRSPDPSGAYHEAVRAVEAAAKPVVLPIDRLATLGKMIRAMRDAPNKWSADLGSVDVVADMMSELWTAQLDRHGTDDESVPLSVSAPQAEAAVHLALVLVHWFRNGHVRVA